MIPETILKLVGKAVTLSEQVVVMDETKVRNQLIDDLVWMAVFGETNQRPVARWLIWEIAQELGIYPSSIQSLYMARGRGVMTSKFTVPAMNLRGMVYDTASALFQTAVKTKTKAFICELARGEMHYSAQEPGEYTTVLLAGAIKAGFTGPIFIQGDHFQTKCGDKPGVPVAGEVEALKKLIQQALEVGFLNIDIDASTLVDLKKRSVDDQQKANVAYTAELLGWIRTLEPAGVTVSVGGEIGHIGGRNSTVEDFVSFMGGLSQAVGEWPSISKISVATGTSHGGVVNRDGSMAQVKVDFEVLKKITKLGREGYGIAGAVQHGASTLPDEMLHKFVEAETAEIHLATGFQNAIMDDEAFPPELLNEMYRWLDATQEQEREPGWSQEQFHYKLRKKCWGKFKQQVWEIEALRRQRLREMLAERFELIFKELNVVGSEETVMEHTPVTQIHKEMVDFAENTATPEVSGLAD
jgi:fructose/tagatose bisphosphate aldolase